MMDYAAALVDQNRQLAEAAFAADLAAPVPTCPGWSLLQLVRHVGRGDRWAAQTIRDRSQIALDPRAVTGGRPPDDEAGARQWLLDSPATVIAASAEAEPSLTVWTFLGPRPAAWWVRRRLHEATIHRADAALAAGQPYALPADLAADGIDEWLDRLVALPPANPALAVGRTLALAATDVGRSWVVTGTDTGLTCRSSDGSGATDADVTLTGPATPLFLGLVRRQSAADAQIDIDGDHALWTDWLNATEF
jgi:uncharacterized protein (TIGR03083 family)